MELYRLIFIAFYVYIGNYNNSFVIR